MKVLEWMFGDDERRPACASGCQSLAALTSSTETMKVQVALCLELVRDMRAEMVDHHTMLIKVLDMDGKTPPFGRPKGVEMPQP